MSNRLLIIALICFVAVAIHGQEPSARKAVLLSLAAPGLGHRYINGDRWGATGSALIMAETGLWLGLASAEWQRRHARQSYQSMATARAGADIRGKDRRFYLLLSDYISSESYVDDLLIRRRWDQLGYASDAANQWEWISEADWHSYRRLRAQADTWIRRRSLLISSLVANRILASLSSILSVRRSKANTSVSVSANTRGLHIVWSI